MSTAAIILIVFGVIVLVPLLLLGGRRAQDRQREKRVHAEAVSQDASYERDQAETLRARAEVTDRVARERAKRERVEAELHVERARAAEREAN